MSKTNRLHRKRVIVFGFEGKNNKTETNYFSHFKPIDDKFILKLVSCGVTDPVNMLKSIKNKRKDFDYNAREDLTFLFVDSDCDAKKRELIAALRSKQPKDITIIVSNPCFELWFLNHFCKTTREFKNSDELITELKKHIPDYIKNQDCYSFLAGKTEIAVANSTLQKARNCVSSTDVFEVIAILKENKKE